MTCSYHKTSKRGGKKTQIKKNMKKSKMTRKTKCVKSKINQKKSRRNRKKRGGFDFSKGFEAAKNSMKKNALLTKANMAKKYKEKVPLMNTNINKGLSDMKNIYNKGLSDINSMYKKKCSINGEKYGKNGKGN